MDAPPKYDKKTIRKCLEYWGSRARHAHYSLEDTLDLPYRQYAWRGEIITEEEFVERTLKIQCQGKLDKLLGVKV
jgi:hypothetical protein